MLDFDQVSAFIITNFTYIRLNSITKFYEFYLLAKEMLIFYNDVHFHQHNTHLSRFHDKF